MNDKKQLKITFTMLFMGIIIVIMLILLLIMVILNNEKQQTIDGLKNTSKEQEELITSLREEKSSAKKVTNSVEDDEEAEKEDIDKENEEVTASKWVYYPPIITNQVLEILGVEDNSNVDTSGVAFKLMEKTLYSLSKKYSKEENNSFLSIYYNKLGIGDSTEIVDTDSNYARYVYPNNENNNLSAKYEDKIEYKIAVFNEGYYDGYYSLDECVKNQYTRLVEEKDYLNYEDVPEDLFYNINKILIMNGNSESKDAFENNSRAKKIKVTINEEIEYEISLEDTNDVQVFDINYKQETIEHPVNIEIEVLEQYDGKESKDVYISDIQFGIDSNIPQGR